MWWMTTMALAGAPNEPPPTEDDPPESEVPVAPEPEEVAPPVVGGMLGGMRDAPPLFHAHELDFLEQVTPTFPQAAHDLHLDNERCRVTLDFDRKGYATAVTVEQCDPLFQSAAHDAVMQWRVRAIDRDHRHQAGRVVLGMTSPRSKQSSHAPMAGAT